MTGQPKMTRRAAEQIIHLEAQCRRDAPPGDYLSFIGCEVEVGPDYSPNQRFRLYYYFSDADGVAEELVVTRHGARMAFNIHQRLLAKLQSPVLDFDGERFVFITNDEAKPG